MNNDYLKQLKTLLRSICHDPNCKSVYLCPEKCLCNDKRDFKLNTKTAMCWTLSNAIASYTFNQDFMPPDTQVNSSIYYPNINQLVYVSHAFTTLSLYHMSIKWRNIFDLSFQIIKIFKEGQSVNNKLLKKAEIQIIKNLKTVEFIMPYLDKEKRN